MSTLVGVLTRPRLFPGAVLVALAAAACSSAHGSSIEPSPAPSTAIRMPTVTTTPADPRAVHANELGMVPVLMYHQLTPHPASVYDRRPKDFRADLQLLADQGYVPITAGEFASGRVDVPAGRHPVVLTFDDGTTSQFRLDGDEPAAGTAVAILMDFAAAHAGFRATATFFVNAAPFGSQAGERVLPWLVEHGFEIGDHTITHANLRGLSPARVQHEIAGNLAMITKAASEAGVRTFALPFGVSPAKASLARQGASGGTRYGFDGVFLVGANPAPSPYAVHFDGGAIPRIRAHSDPGPEAAYESKHWLAYLDAHPSQRFTSDGDADHVSFPRRQVSELSPRWKARAVTY